MTPAEIEERVRQFILANFLTETPPETFQNTDDLFLLLDSLQILRLVVQLEAMFNMKVPQQELTAENLSTVRRIGAFAARKVAARSAD
jgi:acyl carrier protein